MALTASTFSISHFKYEQMRAIPLPENLGLLLKDGKSWKRKKVNDDSVFWGEVVIPSDF